MEKTRLITFATPQFYYARATLLSSATRWGIKKAHAYSGNDFKKTSFYKQQISITSQPRGAGYWLWKPYYIFETLRSMGDGDVLVYCDSGVDIVASPEPLVKLAYNIPSGILLFENYQGSAYFPRTEGMEVTTYNLYIEINKNKYWTKRDAFVLMDADNDRYWNSPQVNANFQIYRKTNESVAFVETWLKYCCNEQIITDLPNSCGKPNFENLFSHIHDQAVLSLTAEKYNVELFRCPSQFGNHYKLPEFRSKGEYLILPYSAVPKSNSEYGTLTNHHRTRYMPFLFRLKTYLRQEINAVASKFNYVVL